MITAVELAGLLGLHEPTDEQAAVIESGLEPAVVIAGAGSGKTETMAARVVWLVANRLVTPDAVLGLTFTRKAAAELGKRLRRRLAQWRRVVECDQPDEQEHLAQLRAGEPTVSTYAAYAGRLVSEQAMRLGAEPDARLLSPAAAWQLADAVVRHHADPLPADIGVPASLTDYVLELTSQFADHLVEVDTVARFCEQLIGQVESLAGNGLPKTGAVADLLRSARHRLALLPLVAGYAASKAAVPAVDFGDQMRVAAQLAGIDEVRRLERSRYTAVLLDEYQDTGHAQIAMLRGLFGGGHPVIAVGDPFQSIYGWRGASAGNIGRFADTFARADGTPAAIHPLATSFRNDRVILQVANAIAEPLRKGGATVPLRPAAQAGPGQLELACTETVDAEAEWVASRLRAAWDAMLQGERTAAVLVRRRSQMPVLTDALLAAGLPVEVVGLGGLLTTPEIVDVVAVLRVLADHKPGRSLARILTGARWRIGLRDLAALRDRARWLARGGAGGPAVDDDDEQPSLVEALDDLGPPDRYSAEGYRRLALLSKELRRLRRRTSGPLAELVAEVEHSIGVDIEVAARPDRMHIGRVHLDRFLDEATRFAADADSARGPTLRAFLAFLDAAEQEEYGLDAGEIVVATERVQLLTVHGAKGLEWDVVAVPGLVDKVFPAEPKSVNWARTRHELPGPLRGDRVDLPTVDLDGAGTLAEVRKRLKHHHETVLEQHAEEERRLAYVAFTRARSVLLASGYAWDSTKSARTPSPFLVEMCEFAAPQVWFVPEEDAPNPVTATARTELWPADPLGARRPDVERGAELVRAALAAQQSATRPQQDMLPLDLPPLDLVPRAASGQDADVVAREPSGDGSFDATVARWSSDVVALLGERQRLRAGGTIDVELPGQLSVSQLVELERDPAELARRIRRPVPMPPAPWARRGTAFHAWLEQRWGAQTLLDIDELPGAADDGALAVDFEELKDAFAQSPWASLTPAQVEVPFEMAVSGVVLRGRMDAVFGSDAAGWLVVDWKTGTRPSGAAARAAAVQLAAYRLAWARLRGIPDDQLHRVGAAFHYVRSNETVRPADLLDAAGLRRLISGGS